MSDADSEPVTNLASERQIALIGLSLLIFSIVLFYVLIASWPVLVEKNINGVNKKVFDQFVLFGFWCDWATDKRVLFTVAIAGAVGSMAPVLTSVSTYVGNGRFSANWIWWYLLRAPVGVVLALLFYCIIRGGLLLPTLSTNGAPRPEDLTIGLNIYGIAAFAALAGMFSKQATDKLEEVFNAVFTRKEPIRRSDPVAGALSIVVKPDKLKQNDAKPLSVTGRGFTAETKAWVGGVQRHFRLVSSTEGTIELTNDDVKEVRKLEIRVVTGDKAASATIEIVAP